MSKGKFDRGSLLELAGALLTLFALGAIAYLIFDGAVTQRFKVLSETGEVYDLSVKCCVKTRTVKTGRVEEETGTGTRSCTRSGYCYGCGIKIDGSFGCGMSFNNSCSGRHVVRYRAVSEFYYVEYSKDGRTLGRSPEYADISETLLEKLSECQ